jgi:hypothetical protein
MATRSAEYGGPATIPEKISVTASGTAGHPITFRAHAGTTPRLDPSAVAGDSCFATGGAQYIVVDGFECTNTVSSGTVYGYKLLWTSNWTIRNGSVHAVGFYCNNVPGTCGGTDSRGIQITSPQTGTITIDNMDVYDIQDVGAYDYFPSATSYLLTVSKPGTGSGTVTSTDGLINCGTVCTARCMRCPRRRLRPRRQTSPRALPRHCRGAR